MTDWVFILNHYQTLETLMNSMLSENGVRVQMGSSTVMAVVEKGGYPEINRKYIDF